MEWEKLLSLERQVKKEPEPKEFEFFILKKWSFYL